MFDTDLHVDKDSDQSVIEIDVDTEVSVPAPAPLSPIRPAKCVQTARKHTSYLVARMHT